MRLSDGDPDRWPAVWLMTVEHNSRQDDHCGNDPRGFERWFELDVDESGSGPGLHGTAFSWTGIWPRYEKLQNPIAKS